MQKSAATADLGALLRQGVTLQASRAELLRKGLNEGMRFYEDYNESRLKLAFGYFDTPMREALYEILYLLHTNTPALGKLTVPVNGNGHGNGHGTGPVEGEPFNLHMPGTPSGVEGIDHLSPVFREDFRSYTAKAFGQPVAPVASGAAPFVMLQSIGSIGTVGHKSSDSDLDLQIIYNLTPIDWEISDWDNQRFLEALRKEQAWWVERLPRIHKLDPALVDQPEMQKKLKGKATQQLASTYPLLFAYLWSRERSLTQDLASGQAASLRTRVVNELATLIKRASVLGAEDMVRKQEGMLNDRVNRIEEYIQRKFPAAEIHLFAFPLTGFRMGRYRSTLESKESSGSAYELLLNYETLMPGIHLTPQVPSHFVFPTPINNDSALYARLMEYIGFGLIDLYRSVRTRLVDMGNTPDVQATYVAEHNGAMYWEAFKASSGNLAKATLNLLRYEMLLEQRLLKTNIQMIKAPGVLDGLVTPKDDNAKGQMELVKLDRLGLPNWAILELEEAFPILRQDPWWLRYKALKIGFGEDQGVEGLAREERDYVSRVADLAFALHVRISDVLTKPGDTRAFKSPREQVLVAYLREAFPPGSLRRISLEQIFIGEVQGVNRFEQDMRAIFKGSMVRVTRKVSVFKIGQQARAPEVELWYQYYLNNFDPPGNVVQRTIMQHLMVARGRLQLGYKQGQGWFFKSLQKESTVGKRFDTFGVLDVLPEEVMLLDKSGFMAGFAHCILNGYVGVFAQGTLKEHRTALEFDGKHMDMGHNVDNRLAFVRPDMLNRIYDRILEFFPYRPFNYMDCIRKERKVTEVFAFLNLWHFGQLCLLYRDNQNIWYCDEINHPLMFQNAPNLSNNLQSMLTAKPVHVSLANFLKQKGVALEDIRFAAWINPNSVNTTHGAAQMVVKEHELSAKFEQVVRKLHAKGGAMQRLLSA